MNKTKGMRAQQSLARRARNNARIYRAKAAMARTVEEAAHYEALAEREDAQAAYRDSEYERISREDD
jgi:hypothetical protein